MPSHRSRSNGLISMRVQEWVSTELQITDTMIDGLHMISDRWTERPPGMNSIAYSLWHSARTQDLVINTLVRARDQRYHAGWDEKVGLRTMEVGLDFSSEEVDALGRSVDVDALYGYWHDVRTDIGQWLSGVDDDELARVPDIDARLAAVPGALRSEGQSLYVPELFRGKPVSFYIQWEPLFHANLHCGELFEIRSALLRAPADG